MKDKKVFTNSIFLFISQIVLILISLFIYHKFVFEKPHISSVGINSFTSQISRPDLDKKTDYIHPTASIIGKVEIGHKVFVAPNASIRGDEGTPLHIGNQSNVQDGVVIHALETEECGHPLSEHMFEEHKKHKKYAVYIGDRVSLAHQSQVHGPAIIEDDTFVGMQALVFNSIVDENCVIEPGAKIIGVHIPAHRYIKAGEVINSQDKADKLPLINDSYKFKDINKAVVNVNTQLAVTYNKLYGY